MQSTSCETLGWMNDKLESRLWKEIPTLRYDDITLMAESEEELKSLLMRVKESENAGLKLNIQKTKIIASGPNTSCHIDGGNSDRFSWTPKLLWTVTTAMKLKDSCSLEEKL